MLIRTSVVVRGSSFCNVAAFEPSRRLLKAHDMFDCCSWRLAILVAPSLRPVGPSSMALRGSNSMAANNCEPTARRPCMSGSTRRPSTPGSGLYYLFRRRLHSGRFRASCVVPRPPGSGGRFRRDARSARDGYPLPRWSWRPFATSTTASAASVDSRAPSFRSASVEVASTSADRCGNCGPDRHDSIYPAPFHQNLLRHIQDGRTVMVSRLGMTPPQPRSSWPYLDMER